MRRSHPVLAVVAGVLRRGVAFDLVLVLLVALAVVTQLVPPLVLERIVNDLAASQGAGIVLLAVCYLGAIVATSLSQASMEAAVVVFGQRITHAMRTRLAAKLEALPASYYERTSSGALTSLFVNDVDTVEALFASGVIGMAADVFSVVGVIAVVFTRSVGLGVILVALLPLLFAFTRFSQRRTLAAQMDNRRAVADANRQIPETLACLRSVRVYGCQAFMRRRYDGAVRRGFEAMERSNFFDSVYSPVIMVTSALVVGVTMMLAATGGAAQAFFGVSVGTAVAFIAYVRQVFTPLDSIGMEIQSIQQAIAGVRRIEAFLGEEEFGPDEQAANRAVRPARGEGGGGAAGPAVEPGGAFAVDSCAARPASGEERVDASMSAVASAVGPCGDAATPAAPADTPAVELRDVRFGYPGPAPVLDGFSLTVARGERVTLVGRTGAGKSTAMKLMLGLHEPQAGSVEVLGTRPALIPACMRRHVFGYVEQGFRMVPGTVADQVSLFDEGVGERDVRRALALVGLLDAVEALPGGLAEPCGPSTFSQGQFQLLSIARAVACDPQVLMLDEITANLDSATEARVMEAIDAASQGRTVVSISHRVYEREAGRIVQVGPADPPSGQ